jgi:hypothetical protein
MKGRHLLRRNAPSGNCTTKIGLREGRIPALSRIGTVAAHAGCLLDFTSVDPISYRPCWNRANPSSHAWAALGGGALAATRARGQETAALAYVPKQSDRSQPLADEEPGFQSIFDGKSLEGWEGAPRYRQVEDGCLPGEVTPAAC